MLAAAEYIRDYACDGIGVDEVVRSVSLSRRAFELRFTDRFGETPKQMIQRVRLERAKQLLESTQLSITQIAMMIGFADVAAFANFVKKQTGSSPTEWRESGAARKRHHTRRGQKTGP
jgi:LacI family transcriptional regulator